MLDILVYNSSLVNWKQQWEQSTNMSYRYRLQLIPYLHCHTHKLFGQFPWTNNTPSGPWNRLQSGTDYWPHCLTMKKVTIVLILLFIDYCSHFIALGPLFSRHCPCSLFYPIVLPIPLFLSLCSSTLSPIYSRITLYSSPLYLEYKRGQNREWQSILSPPNR